MVLIKVDLIINRKKNCIYSESISVTTIARISTNSYNSSDFYYYKVKSFEWRATMMKMKKDIIINKKDKRDDLNTYP